MKRLLPLLLVSITLSFNTHAEKVLSGRQADSEVPGAEMVRLKDFSSIPSFIKFRPQSRISSSEWMTWLTERYLKDNTGVGFELLSEETDQLGITHQRYQQTIDGYPLSFGMWIVHSLNGEVLSMNGELFDDLDGFTASIGKSAALQNALSHMGANTYKWEIDAEEAWLKESTNDPSATYYPEGRLEVINPDISLQEIDLRLAWKFNIYAHEPMARKEVFVDANSGTILFENDLIHHVDSNAVAYTGYSGQQTIVTDYTGTNFRLQESGRGNGIATFDMNNTTGGGNGVDIFDNDNVWQYNNIDQYALDAHFGAEMTYDYFWESFNRNSIDNNGFQLISRVHYDVNYVNAFWDGQRMTYGDGNAAFTPLTTLDIAGHEIAHGLTNFTSNLVYQDEPGALNESFSDIFGACVEFFALGFNQGDWTMGEDIGNPFRNMSNPNQFQDPDTYDGDFWYTGPNDNGGVHINSGVQNFWFYLLTVGGSGTNDIGDVYNVTGIGMDDAGAIAYRNDAFYLTVTSQFNDARFYAIESALDLFGPCSQQVISTGNAWYAVGVGNPYSAFVDADFSSNTTGNCYVPLDVEFYNFSSNATSYSWDFGDGTTSNLANPQKTYTSPGTYTVNLTVSSSCGTDSTIQVDYIEVGPGAPCEVILPSTGQVVNQSECEGTIYDNGGPGGEYANDANSYVVIYPTGAGSVTLSISDFDIEAGNSGTSCNYDYLEILDGPGLSSPVLGKYCNNNLPPAQITSSSSAITVRFFSDGGITEPGFRIDWECNDPTVQPAADFEANVFETCDGEVNFTDLSMDGAQSWYWDFGDGNSDTNQNPSHQYSNSGLYDVTMVASNGFGSDTVVKTSYIQVNRPDAPVVQTVQICPEESAQMQATGNGDIFWYDSPASTNPISEGSMYTTPVLQNTTTYYVESVVPGLEQSAGAAGNGIGSGGYLNFPQSLYFDAYTSFILHTVKVYASSTGNREIVLLDDNGNTLDTKTVNLSFGQHTVELDFLIEPGIDYQLTLGGNGIIDLYRNDGGTDYPYTLEDVLSVTRSSANTAPYGYYYYFYDWKVKEFCVSERSEAVASTSVCLGIEDVEDAGVQLFPNPAREQVSIQFNSKTIERSIVLTDMKGQQVMRANNVTKATVELDVRNLAKGVYSVRILEEGVLTETLPLIIQ